MLHLVAISCAVTFLVGLFCGLIAGASQRRRDSDYRLDKERKLHAKTRAELEKVRTLINQMRERLPAPPSAKERLTNVAAAGWRKLKSR